MVEADLSLHTLYASWSNAAVVLHSLWYEVFTIPKQIGVHGTGARRIPSPAELLQNHLRILEHFKIWISKHGIKSLRMFTFTKVCWTSSLLANIFIKIRLEKGRKGFLS